MKVMKQILYFAYGSNLDGRQMRARCAGAEAEATAILPNHALAFGGFSHRWGGAVATIVPARGAQVEGLLYRLPPKEIFTLDRYEGCPTSYQRLAKMVTDEHGRRRRAEVYVQPRGGLGLWAPPPRYTQVIRRAYRQLGFDTGSLAAAIEVAQ
jgi:cation transport regulator ChaC